MPEHLDAMRFVLARPAREDRTPLHQACRKQLNAKPAKFMELKGQMEIRWLEAKSAQKPKSGGPKPEADVLGDLSAIEVG